MSEEQVKYGDAYIWTSVDPSKASTGYCIWNKDKLVTWGVITPYGAKGRYKRINEDGHVDVYDNRVSAFIFPFLESVQVFIERGAGAHPQAVRAQGWICGYIEHAADMYGAEYVEIAVSEWRRTIKEMVGVSWPSGREDKKALSIKIARQLSGQDMLEDAAEAYLLGRAMLRQRRVNWASGIHDKDEVKENDGSRDDSEDD